MGLLFIVKPEMPRNFFPCDTVLSHSAFCSIDVAQSSTSLVRRSRGDAADRKRLKRYEYVRKGALKRHVKGSGQTNTDPHTLRKD
ncbi:hypothetical protein COCON_G00103250 [Conger conger]|uniref:Uncharacterized protein n=1 Tax=Conger conger TaxID=82655 RepID=A0A9Q1HXL1_CONCO|nr:hypothetical protein COCON_G00103250 [Conger conger]